MEYVFLSVLAGLLVALVLMFRPTHRESAMRGAMQNQKILDAEQARQHREILVQDIPPQRAKNKTIPELLKQYAGRNGKKAEAWCEMIQRQGGSVWVDEHGMICFQTADGIRGTQSFSGDWD